MSRFLPSWLREATVNEGQTGPMPKLWEAPKLAASESGRTSNNGASAINDPSPNRAGVVPVDVVIVVVFLNVVKNGCRHFETSLIQVAAGDIFQQIAHTDLSFKAFLVISPSALTPNKL